MKKLTKSVTSRMDEIEWAITPSKVGATPQDQPDSNEVPGQEEGVTTPWNFGSNNYGYNYCFIGDDNNLRCLRLPDKDTTFLEGYELCDKEVGQ